jgi:hypothetical protein
VNGGGGSSGEGRRVVGFISWADFWVVFSLLLFFFVLFISFTFFATVSPRLIDFDEGSTTHRLKKVKEVMGKTRAATG